MREVYLDNAAATPIDPRVVEAMTPYIGEHFGNPTSLHHWGSRTREAVEEARDEVARLIGARSEEIIFVASGSEANNLALKGLAAAQGKKGKHVIVSTVEHFSVLHSARALEALGFEVTYIPVDSRGLVDPEAVRREITDATVLISIMHANGEVGTIQPIAEIAGMAREHGTIFHADAVATAGTIPVKVGDLGVDSLSLAANQFYGPSGAAALYVRKGVRIRPQLDGGTQERGRRAGTENVAGLVGFGRAAALASAEMKGRIEHIVPLRDRLIAGLVRSIDHLVVSGHPTARLPGNVHVRIEYIEGESMLLMLDMKGVAAASGSACTSRALKPSHVLTAMGVPHEKVHGSLLMSIGKDNSAEDIDWVLEVLPPIVDRLRQMSPLARR